jgi:hypothetical protein
MSNNIKKQYSGIHNNDRLRLNITNNEYNTNNYYLIEHRFNRNLFNKSSHLYKDYVYHKILTGHIFPTINNKQSKDSITHYSVVYIHNQDYIIIYTQPIN